MSGEKSKARTVFIWFILPWIFFTTAITYLYMNNKNDSSLELKPFVNLIKADTQELIILDEKRAKSEGIKDERNMPQYYKGNNNIGVLLIHGFTASPFEMNELAIFLNKKGFSVYNLRIAGHGSTPQNLNVTNYKDWYESLKYGYYILKKNNEKIYVIGQSMGGLLAMTLSFYNPVDKMVLLSPALFIADPKFKIVSVAKYFIDEIKKSNFKKKDEGVYYNVRPVKALYQLSKLIEYTKNNIDKFKTPFLLIQSKYDNVVNADKVVKYLQSLNLKNSSIIELADNKKINHVLTTEDNPEKDKIFEIIYKYLEAD